MNRTGHATHDHATSSERTELVLLVFLAALIAVYMIIRYGGHWGENDTATFTRAIRSVADTGRLSPGPGYGVYTNGYNYSALVVFLMNLCGLTLADLQLYVAPLLMVWLIFPAWLAYRELTGTARGASLATVIVLTQPELLFVLLRGTHEKFTRGLMLLCLYLLMRSLRSRHAPAYFVSYVLAFYLVSYALITSNNLMAMSFAIATGTALGFVWVISRRQASPSQSAGATIRRLGYITTTLFILSFIFLFYIYTPALHGFLLLKTMWEQTSSMVLDAGTPASNPYSVVNSLWIHPLVYVVLSLANWLLLIASVAVWLVQGLRWWRRRPSPQAVNELLLWAYYGAFAVQCAVSILVDVSGALASNLQLRLFPSFVLLAAPLVAKYLVDARPKSMRLRRIGNAALWLGLGVLALLSTLKATSDPLLSNKWFFYTPGEMRALDWAEVALQKQGLWLEYDERLFAAARIRNGASALNVYPDWGDVDPGTQDFLISGVTQARSVRLAQPLPIEVDSFLTYDNGQAQIYHRRPRTPYQP